jgi:hypothetical protein
VICFFFSLLEAAAVDRAMIEEIMKEMREKPAFIIQDPQINTVGLSANQVTLTPAVYLYVFFL